MKRNMTQLLDDILSVLQTIRDDKSKLEKLHDFVMEEIYEEPEEPKIPKKLQKVMSGIADSITAGFVCYVNPDTWEVEEIPRHALEEPEDYEAMTGKSTGDFHLKHQEWENCIEVEPPESYDSFNIMERFVEQLPDANLQKKLMDSLGRKRPFANFKRIVDNSDYCQDWFTFRQKGLEQYVYEMIENEKELFDMETPIYNGFYDDDGNKINPHSVPVPGLRLLCKSYDSTDWEENILCLMNRYDQKNEKGFVCGAYEKNLTIHN